MIAPATIPRAATTPKAIPTFSQTVRTFMVRVIAESGEVLGLVLGGLSGSLGTGGSPDGVPPGPIARPSGPLRMFLHFVWRSISVFPAEKGHSILWLFVQRPCQMEEPRKRSGHMQLSVFPVDDGRRHRPCGHSTHDVRNIIPKSSVDGHLPLIPRHAVSWSSVREPQSLTGHFANAAAVTDGIGKRGFPEESYLAPAQRFRSISCFSTEKGHSPPCDCLHRPCQMEEPIKRSGHMQVSVLPAELGNRHQPRAHSSQDVRRILSNVLVDGHCLCTPRQSVSSFLDSEQQSLTLHVVCDLHS